MWYKYFNLESIHDSEQADSAEIFTKQNK